MAFKSMLPDASKRFSIKVGILFARLPLTPNMWTVVSLVPAVIGLYLLLQHRLLAALAAFVAAAAMDAIDGGVARVRGQATNYGAYLDGMTDRFVEAALLFGLMAFGYADWILPGWAWLALMLFFGTTMTTFARAYADHRKVVTDPEALAKMGGVLERAERLVLIFVSMAVWFVNPVYATQIVALGSMLAALTVVQRMLAVHRLHKD
ncbi:MAG: CDP-alcohol phosphatidyltransferase family protein [Candidatus Aenigmarchaeota archaeon]|nr:CDP-alcohol phosphatidyltransferase family protein [Candidatus Aenigmarchaeota archaeon]